MADEQFFPGTGDFPSGLGAAPFFGSSYAPPPGLDAAMQGFGGLAWADLQLMPDSSAATTATAHFDSALSSLVSSPAHCSYGGDDVAIGDLIGRLGSICSAAGVAASANNSCYSTPLSSPPRGASPSAAAAAALAFRGSCGYPGGASTAAHETAGTGRLSRVASSKSLGAGAAPPALDGPEPETSPTMGGGTEMRDPAPPPPAKGAARKRKASGKGKATFAPTTVGAAGNASPKRPKVAAGGGGGDGDTAAPPEPEPAKDYIHVRARRGQATDSHSLAERVRRERISERMKMLQSLVPGCNKITGKALMLDEIINYVQSLQRQVEFLSMKLATMNPELDADARHQAATEMLMTSSHPPAAAATAFSSYAADLPFLVGAAAHPAQLDSFSGWEVQDLESVVVRHSHATAAAHGHDLYASPTPPAHDSFHGQLQQGTATASHMKLEH